MHLIDVTKKFATPEACNDFLESMRWPDGVRCLKCNSAKVTKYRKNEGTRQRKNRKTGEMETKRVPARILYFCVACKHQFSATTGTIFNDTHLDLEKWFMAVALMVDAKKGLSALQLQRDLTEEGKKPAYKTAWYLSHRIRQAMALLELADTDKLTGTVEADETYLGGRYDKRRKREKWDKPPVFGVIQRDGKAKTFHMPTVTLKRVEQKLKDNVSIDATAIHTDESSYYGTAAGTIKSHQHETVNHIAKEWVRGDVHTGTIDGYWGLLKRGIIGSYHQVSVKHLSRYLAEFQFRWNHRDSPDIFALVIAALVIGSALQYSELISWPDSHPTPHPKAPLDKEPF